MADERESPGTQYQTSDLFEATVLLAEGHACTHIDVHEGYATFTIAQNAQRRSTAEMLEEFKTDNYARRLLRQYDALKRNMWTAIRADEEENTDGRQRKETGRTRTA